MSALLINYISFPASVQNFQETTREIGETTNAFDGTIRKSRIAIKSDFKFSSTVALTNAEGFAWDKLIQGTNQHWSWDSDLYSSRGLGPVAGYTANQQTSVKRLGAGALRFNGSSKTISYAAVLGSSWTYALHRSTDAGSTWTHYLVTSGGHKWVDGVRNDAATTTFAAVSSGTLTLTDTNTYMDDLVAFPFAFPDSWGTSVYDFFSNSAGGASGAYPGGPKLVVQGDLVQDPLGYRVMVAPSGTPNTTFVQSGNGSIYRQLDVTLQEF